MVEGVVEVAFQKYDSCLKKLANVFSYKSRGTIESGDFYQEFAYRLIELLNRAKCPVCGHQFSRSDLVCGPNAEERQEGIKIGCGYQCTESDYVYRSADAPGFKKILNFSLHNLGVVLLRQRFSYFTVDHNDEANASLFKTVVEPSFLFFYREATLSILRSVKAREIFQWLVDHPEVVERVRDEKNLVQLRCRRVVLADVIDTVVQTFHMPRCEVRHYVNQIRKAVWSIYTTEFVC